MMPVVTAVSVWPTSAVPVMVGAPVAAVLTAAPLTGLAAERRRIVARLVLHRVRRRRRVRQRHRRARSRRRVQCQRHPDAVYRHLRHRRGRGGGSDRRRHRIRARRRHRGRIERLVVDQHQRRPRTDAETCIGGAASTRCPSSDACSAWVRIAAVVAPVRVMVPPSRASASAFHEMPLLSTSPACTVRANTNAALSEPLA